MYRSMELRRGEEGARSREISYILTIVVLNVTCSNHALPPLTTYKMYVLGGVKDVGMFGCMS